MGADPPPQPRVGEQLMPQAAGTAREQQSPRSPSMESGQGGHRGLTSSGVVRRLRKRSGCPAASEERRAQPQKHRGDTPKSHVSKKNECPPSDTVHRARGTANRGSQSRRNFRTSEPDVGQAQKTH